MKVFYFSALVVIIDQITKILVKGIYIPFLNVNIVGMDEHQSFNVFGEFFKITFVENPGMAFGIGVNSEIKLLLSLFSIIAGVGIAYYIYISRNERFIFRFALALILGGAIGNLIDRTFYGVIYGYAPLFYGHVVDFFNVEFFDFTFFGQTYERFPVFNIADSAVSIGVVLLLLFNKAVPEKKAEEEEITDLDNTEQIDDTKIQPDGKNNN
ncbi:MAG TPA: signal peptidase II [Melioribacteraceae bacterium]|nr:signal peptidase II [Melioribacteraceae bacterium]